jgi:hypothetical protein
MPCDDGQFAMTSDERLRAVAAIFAGAILRLRQCTTSSSRSGEIPVSQDLSQSNQNCLEVSDETVLSVHTG